MADPVVNTGNQGGTAGNEGAAAGIDLTTYIPADVANEPSLKMFDLKSKDGVENFIKSYVSSQKMIGGEKLVIPRGANDTPEAWARYYEAGGRPKTDADYQAVDPKLPKGMKTDENLDKEFRKLAHDLGLSQKSFGKLSEFYNGVVTKNHEDMIKNYNTKYEAAQTALKGEWGDQFSSNVALANKVLRTFGGSAEEIKGFTDLFANEPVVLRVFAAIGKRIEESALIAGETSDLDLGMDDAKKKRADIMTNDQNPLNKAFYDKRHARHQEAMDEVARLSKVISGDDVIHEVGARSGR